MNHLPYFQAVKSRLRRALGIPLVIVATTGMIAVAPASQPARSSQDPLAPAGARPRWLPCQDWAMYHWIPYDERRLFSMLAVDRAAVERWLRDDDVHTLAQLVRRRGRDPGEVARQLVSAWAGEVSEEHRAVLYDRALRTLTQGHLSQHLFFHFAHYPAVAAQARLVFGLAPLAYQRFRMAGWTPAEIAQRHGRSPALVRELTIPILRSGADRGIAEHATPPAQARRVLRLQRVNLGAWLDQRIRPLGRLRDLHVPLLRSREERACWLFAGHAGVEQLRRPGAARTASLVCALPLVKRKEPR